MKKAIIFILIMTCSMAFAKKDDAAEEGGVFSAKSKNPNYIKNWYVGIGPAWSTALVNAPNSTGTRFTAAVGYTFGLSEKWNLSYFYRGNYNSQAMGKSDIDTITAELNYFTLDRGAETSPFIRAGLGYGGSNRNMDGGPAFVVGVGFQFFRTKEWTLEVALERVYIYTTTVTTTLLNNYPSVDVIRLGTYF